MFSANSGGNLTGYCHGFKYDAAATAVSFGRYVISTGDEQFPAQITTTLGAAEQRSRKVGPLVITEIMYNPAPGGDEFIKIQNISNNTVNLFNANEPTHTWHLKSVGYYFPQNTQVLAGGILLVVQIAPTTFRARYNIPATVNIVGPYPGALNNGGENVALEWPDATNVDPLSGIPTVPYVVDG